MLKGCCIRQESYVPSVPCEHIFDQPEKNCHSLRANEQLELLPIEKRHPATLQQVHSICPQVHCREFDLIEQVAREKLLLANPPQKVHDKLSVFQVLYQSPHLWCAKIVPTTSQRHSARHLRSNRDVTSHWSEVNGSMHQERQQHAARAYQVGNADIAEVELVYINQVQLHSVLHRKFLIQLLLKNVWVLHRKCCFKFAK